MDNLNRTILLKVRVISEELSRFGEDWISFWLLSLAFPRDDLGWKGAVGQSPKIWCRLAAY